jgi:anaerobic sulfite reductase subunit B
MTAPSDAPTAVRPCEPEEAAMVPAPFTVAAKRRDTEDTWTLELHPRAGPGLAVAPGQFTMLAAGGRGEVPVSISGGSGGDTLAHTVRAVGLATAAICETPVGGLLGVRGPFGRPWPMEEIEGADVVVVAGGIGLAPLRPVVLDLLARRGRYGKIVLLYGDRSPDRLLYTAELEQWRERGLEVEVTVDRARPEWQGRVGVVPALVGEARFDPARAAALLCGPEVMMRFTAEALAEAGVPGDRVWASMERNMQCGIGLCGHCQFGPLLLCRDGPVCRWDALESWIGIKEL